MEKKKEEQESKKDRIQTDFLLREHEYFTKSFAENEAVGEKRVNFLITIVLAILAALVGLVSVESTIIDLNIVLMVGIFVMFGLLLLSRVTLLRIIYRNKRTDEWKDRLDKVRDQFRKLDKRLEDYYPFGKKIQRRTGFREFGTGGLVEFTMAITTILLIALVEFIVGGLFLLFDMFLSLQMTVTMVVAFIATFPLSWYGLKLYVSKKYEEREDSMFEWRMFWTDEETKPWKTEHIESIENFLKQTEVEEREDYYIDLGHSNSSVKITCNKEDNEVCRLELKYLIEPKGKLEKWAKPVSLLIKEEIKPHEGKIERVSARGLEEVLNSLSPKVADERSLISMIRMSVHLILSGKSQLVSVSKKRTRVRAHFDRQSKTWQFQLSRSKHSDTVILELTDGTIIRTTSRNPEHFRTVCVEGEKEDMIGVFKKFFINEEVGQVSNYPTYIQNLQ